MGSGSGPGSPRVAAAPAAALHLAYTTAMPGASGQRGRHFRRHGDDRSEQAGAGYDAKFERIYRAAPRPINNN